MEAWIPRFGSAACSHLKKGKRPFAVSYETKQDNIIFSRRYFLKHQLIGKTELRPLIHFSILFDIAYNN